MIQIEEFLGEDSVINANNWLSANPRIHIVDIKYSVSTYQESENYMAQAYSGVLIVYKVHKTV